MASETDSRSKELEAYCRALRQLHDLQLRHHVTYREQCSDFLEVGCALFGMSTGIVSRVEEGMYHIDAVRSPSPKFRVDQSFSLGDTLCDRVIREDRTIAIEDLGHHAEWRGHPAYRDLAVRAYIAAPIRLRTGIFGTLNFTSTEPRAAPFSEFEIEILDLMAESMARFLDLKRADEIQSRMRREQAQREIRQAAQLGRSERLATLGMLATGVAHEINNPLQGMRSHLSVLRRALPADFPRAESLEMVDKGIESIAEIVSQLLTLQTPELQTSEHGLPQEAVAFVVKFLGPDFRRRKVCMHNRLSSDLRPVGMSQQHMTQVLLNLLINARDAMPEGGEVWLDAEQNETETHLSITDNGCGFEPTLAEGIFAPFYTTKGAHGTGLGLTVAESLVRNAKGRILANSEVGKGSSFHLHLPNARVG